MDLLRLTLINRKGSAYSADDLSGKGVIVREATTPLSGRVVENNENLVQASNFGCAIPYTPNLKTCGNEKLMNTQALYNGGPRLGHCYHDVYGLSW